MPFSTRLVIRLFFIAPVLAFVPPSTKFAHKANLRSIPDVSYFALDLYKHTLAVLTLPTTSKDRIANEAILTTCMAHTSSKLSVVLRCQDGITPQLNDLRGYVGEVYSLAWDVVLNLNGESQSSELLNVLIYPRNLPYTR